MSHKARSSSDTPARFEMLEPRLLLSTSTIHFRDVAGAGYTEVDFDDCQLRGTTDTASNSYNSAMRDGTDLNYFRTLLGIKDMFTELPGTDVNGGVIDIVDADLHIFRYSGGDANDTVYVNRMTTDWLTDAAGSSEADTTYKHRDKSSDLHWNSGSDFGSGDYTATNQASDSWGTSYKQEIVIDVTDLVADIYDAEVNYGFVLSTDVSDAILYMCSSEIDNSGYPSLEIEYQYKYTLTVNSGTGDGEYASGTNDITVTADAPAEGYEFDVWTGDTEYLDSATSVTPNAIDMPAEDISITATYKASTTYTLTVVNGTGDGDYAEGETPHPTITADAPATGYEFAQWTGDTSYLDSSVTTNPNTVDMPAQNISVTATYSQIDYTLTVTSGTGDGTYHYQDTPAIAADDPATGYEFDEWTGDTGYVTDVNDPTTTVTMPAGNVSVTATYSEIDYTLTVTDGTGDGTYNYQDTPSITADSAPEGEVFYRWAGDADGVADVYDPTTTITMPAHNTTITATYIVDNSQTIHLREVAGTGYTTTNFDDTYIKGDSDDSFGTAYKALMQNGSGSEYYATLIGAADLFTELPKTDANGGVIDITRAFLNVSNYEGSGSDTVYINRMTTNWLPDTAGANENDVSFEHSDKSTGAHWNSGSDFGSGDYTATNQVTYTWSDTFRAEKTIDITGILEDIYSNNANYGFVLRTSATTNTVEVCTSEISGSGWPSLEIAYAYKYTLAVTDGTGDGEYYSTDVVDITADAAPTGKEFDVWTGDTTGIADVNDSTTTITMPAADASINATYKWIDRTLTVNSGTGDGTTYHYGEVVPVAADAPATGYEFDVWTGDTAGLADVNAASTNYTMPNSNATITATYDQIDYTLTVTDGTGDGTYHYQDTPSITADTPPTGKQFDAWTGDTAYVTNVNSASTTVTMPAGNVTVAATYEWIDRTLVVNYGTGDGTTYHYGQVVDITADDPESGYQFDVWTGDTTGIADVNDPTTTITMPNSNATITATYELLGGTSTIHFRDTSGTGYTEVDFDDCQIRGTNDTVSNGYNSAMRDGTGLNYFRTLLGIKDMFTELPITSGGETIEIVDAQLHIFKYYGGDSGDTVYVSRVTTDWLTDAAGSSEADTTWEHRDKSSDLDWTTSGGDFGADDYTTTNQASHAWADSYKEEIVIDVTDLVADIYDAEVNYGFVFSTDVTDENRTFCTSEIDVSGWPSLEIEYRYGSGTTYALTVNNGTGDGNYEENDEVGIAADAPATGYEFNVWTGDTTYVTDVNDPTTTVTMPAQAVSVTATYSQIDYTLTVNSGTGDGTYHYQDTPGITADSPATGYEFDQWTGDTAYVTNVNSASTTVTMPAGNVTVTATYSQIDYTLTVNSGTGDGTYHYQDTPGITADAPGEGYVFDEWTGDTQYVTNVNASSTTVTMPAGNVTVTATYVEATTYTLTVNSGTGDGNYEENDEVPIAADSPATGYEFDVWTGDTSYVANVNSASTTVTMPAQAVTVTATYVQTDYTLTVNSGTGDGTYHYQDTPGITADTPATGYEFDEWTGDTQYVTNVNASSTTVTMPAGNVTVTATYSQIDYTLTVNSGTGDGTFHYQDTPSITADTPQQGYEFDAWTGDTSYVTDIYDASTTVTMPAGNVTVTATYVESGSYTLTVVDGTGDGTHDPNDVVNIAADTPPSGEAFYCWTGDYIDRVADIYDPTTTYTMPAASATITANFSPYSEVVMNLADGVSGFVDVAVDDCQLIGTQDTPSGTGYQIGIRNGTGSAYYAGLIGMKDLFTELPKTSGSYTIEIVDADLHLFRYGGDSGDTVKINRVTTNWLTDAAGSSESDTTFKHRDKSSDLHWASGDFSSSDYDTGTTASGSWGDGWGEHMTFDVTSLVASIYSTENNYGFVLRSEMADSHIMRFFTSDAGETQFRPYLSITYTYHVPTPMYDLVVDNGSGDGFYYVGEEVTSIVADTPAAGKKFNMWVGDVGYHDGMTRLPTDYLSVAQIDYISQDRINSVVEVGDKFKVTLYDSNGENPQTEVISASSTSTETTALQIRDAINNSTKTNFTKVTAGYAYIQNQWDAVNLTADTAGVAFFTTIETTESDDSPADGQTFTWKNDVPNHTATTNNITKSTATYTMPAYDAIVIATYRDSDAPSDYYDWFPKADFFNQTWFGAEAEDVDSLVYDLYGSTLAWEAGGDYKYESKNSAFVACETNLPTTAYVEYGTTTNYGTEIYQSDRYNYLHMFYLPSLSASQTYHYRFVAKDERGNEITGSDKTLTTVSGGGWTTLSGGSRSTPHTLSSASTYYLLTGDLVAEGKAFEITADGVTLDLGGYTVIYNNVDDQETSNWLNSAMGVRSMYKNNLTIVNGTIKQGDGFNDANSSGTGYAPVYLYDSNNSDVIGITAEYDGAQIQAIDMPYGDGDCVAHHNVIIDRGSIMINRHQGADAIHAVATVHHNLILRARHRGIGPITGSSGNHSEVYNNEIYVDAVCTNGYGIYTFGDYTDIYNNRIFGGGQMFIGIGTLGDSYSSSTSDYIDMYDNLIHVQAAERDWRWPEYFARCEMDGYTNRWGNTNSTFHDNTVIAFARDGGFVRGLWVYPMSVSTNNVIEDNVIKAMHYGYDQAQIKGAVAMSGSGGTDQASVELTGNTIISNFCNVAFGDVYGSGGNSKWYSNTLVKVSGRTDYVTFHLGDAGEAITGDTLYDTVFQGGASYDQVDYTDCVTGSWFAIGWTLTVNTDAGATVEIYDSTEALVSSGTANGIGVYTAELIQYRQAETGKTYYTDHTVEVSLGGEYNETDVTMDATKSIYLYPV